MIVPRLVGSSLAMQKVCWTARRAAASRASVLVIGERGTGKKELARTIHALGPRADAPFVVAAHAADAARDLTAHFEEARGGTLFIHEIGELADEEQRELLCLLSERTLDHARPRVVAGSRRDLVPAVVAGRFREDLYCHASVITVEMPPLRARGMDTLLLASHFLQKFAAANDKQLDGFDDEARTWLVARAWPGNVEDLEQAIEDAVGRAQDSTIRAADLDWDGPTRTGAGATATARDRSALPGP